MSEVPLHGTYKTVKAGFKTFQQKALTTHASEWCHHLPVPLLREYGTCTAVKARFKRKKEKSR